MMALHIREMHKEIALKVAVGAILCVASFHFFIKPVFSEKAFLEQQIQGSQARLELFREVTRLKGTLSATEQPLAPLTARGSLVGKISDMANKYKVDVQTLTPKTIPEGEYVRLRIELAGEASYFSLLQFLKELESFELPLKVGNISFSRQSRVGSGQESKPVLQTRFFLETYLLKQTKKGHKS